MKTYRARLKKGVKGVYGISLVDQPAMEGDFVQFSKQEEVEFAEVDKSKNRVMGLILEPNKIIPRDGYNVVLTEEDVKDVAYNFQKQSYQNNSTIQHDGISIDDVTFVELWLIEDEKMDKSVSFGFNYPKGSWMGVMEINNEVTLNKVRNGTVKGFSIDALMSFEEVNLNKQVNMENQEKEAKSFAENFLKFLKLGFSQSEEVKEVKAEEVVEEVKEEVVAKATETEEVAVVAETKEEVVEEIKEEAVAMSKEDMEKAISEKVELAIAEKLKPIQDANIELTKEVDTLKAENLVLSKEPATKSVGKEGVFEKLEYKDMNNRQKMEYNQNK